MCERWRTSFLNFYADMGPRPTEHHSLDRIDNSGNYEPENCRWSTKKEQCRNRRTNVRYCFAGKELTLPEWSEQLGIPLVTLQKRLSLNLSYDLLFSDQRLQGGLLQSKRQAKN